MFDQPIIVLPLDARPVCYDQVLDLAAIGGLNVILPPKPLLGVLKQPAPLYQLCQWWQDQLSQYPHAAVIFSLDTMAYGGLIASRVNTEPPEILKSRIQQFFNLLQETHWPRSGFASILRIPNYNNAEEEPDYWEHYGEQLYQLSAESHRLGKPPTSLQKAIPTTILEDFLFRREKNFQLNQFFLTCLKAGKLDLLVFCQDDTGEYGLNVQEAQALSTVISEQGLETSALVQTGADEVALTMLTKAVWQKSPSPLKVYPWFFPEQGAHVLARFDGLPIGHVVQRHLKTLGAICTNTPEEADLIVMIHAPSQQMGDHCSRTQPVRTVEDVHSVVSALSHWLPQKPVTLADVVYANGADPLLMHACLEAKVPLDKLFGYAAWNTPGNTIGTALSMGAMSVWAQQSKRLNDAALKKLLLKRFLDDWVYQADVRLHLRDASQQLPSEVVLNQKMFEQTQLFMSLMNLPDLSPQYSFPCNRFFEVAIQV